ncbi:MAG TPA: NAD(P)-dependent oxidoreductase [Candidatus Acidoferrum sp.]|nr:NAD(P)-dependent oxidoreductase [Candidatus Acidoferrum sp.]
MPISPRLGPEAAAANMADYKPRYQPQEALLEASRCLFCFDAPCIQACPTGIDIPSFIKKIANGNLTGAARTILNANVLGASCARVCPTQVLCEGACVMLDREGDPVKIGRLQRYATDHVFEKKISVLQPAAKKTGKRVAIIGSGPAGLGCAAELARLGHAAVVFEKTAKAGGLNTYGIAYYKMPPKVSLEEVELIRGLGVEFRCGVEVGKDITTAQLEKEFDAIFVGIGLSGSPKLNVPGEGLPEVVDALHFIAQIRMQPLHQVPVGERVAVIGGGNTAIDAVTQARRLGARDAAIVYRRTQPDMSAYEFEQELAKIDGARFLFNVVPVEIMSQGGHVSGLKLARTKTENGKVQVLPGTEFVEPFDMVIKAIGEEKQVSLLKALFPQLELDPRGAVVHDAGTGRTNLPKVFAGGDCANGGREVVNAVAEGKKAARAMHALFAGEKVTGPVQASRLGVKDGAPVGSGFDRPIRVPELEEEYFKGGK